MMTYAELQLVVGRAAGLLDPDADELARIQAAAGQALRDVATARRWPYYQASLSLILEAGDSAAVLPADFLSFDRGVWIQFATGSHNDPLGEVPLDTIRAARNAGSVAGVPGVWAWGDTSTEVETFGQRSIELYPDSDGAYSLLASYRRLPVTPTAGADVLDAPEYLADALPVAAKIAAKQEFNESVPEEWEARLQRVLEQAWTIAGLGSRPMRQLAALSPRRDPLAGLPRGRTAAFLAGHWPEFE